MACKVKANINWASKNIIFSHYFRKKFKLKTLQEHEK